MAQIRVHTGSLRFFLLPGARSGGCACLASWRPQSGAPVAWQHRLDTAGVRPQASYLIRGGPRCRRRSPNLRLVLRIVLRDQTAAQPRLQFCAMQVPLYLRAVHRKRENKPLSARSEESD